MNHVLKKHLTRLVLATGRRSFSNTNFALAGFIKDFKPLPFPASEAERVAAAKKYGMKPEDYEPMANDGFGFGDYPKLPDISSDMKSPFAEYDDPVLRRNYGEPVHILQEAITLEKTTFQELPLPHLTIVLIFVLTFTSFFGVGYLLNSFKFQVPAVSKFQHVFSPNLPH